MNLLNANVLVKAGKRNKPLALWLAAWSAAIDGAEWNSIEDVRQTYPSADGVVLESGTVVTIFNVKGNNYRLLTWIDYDEAIVEVLDVHQQTINRQGVGFKGFIPAVFGRLVSESFGRRATGLAEMKVTAPAKLIRNSKARADEWEGTVINVRHDSFRGAADPAMLDQANIVEILHDDGTIGLYAHLHWESIRVQPGQSVRRGQYIADSGSTGLSSGPHLHFAVIRNAGMHAESVPVQFAGAGGATITPQTGMLLTAY